MRYRIWLLNLAFFVYPIFSEAQSQDKEPDLAFFADVMMNARDGLHRERAAKEIRTIMESVLADPNNQYDYNRIPWISTLVPQDSTFRIFTWQWEGQSEQIHYEGAIQFRNGPVFWFKNISADPSDAEYFESRPEHWFGQVYYNIHQYEVEGHSEYLLFGYRKLKSGHIIKTAEPIYISDGEVRFGKELFFDDNRHGKNRLIIKYSDSTTASLKFDQDLGKIVFDNIVSIINPYESGAVRLVPEGTYKAYALKNGKWYFEENILD
nr:hypothetical protein [Saprospiraceae bacterium]